MIKIEAVLKAAFEILDHFQKNRELKIKEFNSNNCFKRRCAADNLPSIALINHDDQKDNLFKLYQD